MGASKFDEPKMAVYAARLSKDEDDSFGHKWAYARYAWNLTCFEHGMRVVVMRVVSSVR